MVTMDEVVSRLKVEDVGLITHGDCSERYQRIASAEIRSVIGWVQFKDSIGSYKLWVFDSGELIGQTSLEIGWEKVND